MFEDADGVLVLGDEKSLAVLVSGQAAVIGSPAPQALSKVGPALSTAGEMQAQSGRWLKMTEESDQARPVPQGDDSAVDSEVQAGPS